MSDYKLNIPKEGSELQLLTLTKTVVSNSYSRVVYGKKCPMVEFSKHQIIDKVLYIQKADLFRLSDPRIYSIKFKTNDASNATVRYQMRNVAYTDYEIGYFYIDINDLLVNKDGELEKCIKPKYYINELPSEFFETV